MTMAGRSRGQPPIPIDRKRLQTPAGHKPTDYSRAAREHRGDPVPTVTVGKVPTVPKALKVGLPGRVYWRMYWTHAMGWLTAADYPTVLRLCQMHDVCAKLMREIEADGLTHMTERGGKSAHSLLVDWRHISLLIERLECLLGLNPVERSRIRISAETQESSLDAWRRGRERTSSTQ
jgi:hypothetical protein